MNICWIRNNQPDVYEKTRWFLTSQAYLVYRLTSTASIDIYTASGYAPLFDINDFGWYEDVARHITPVDRLPQAYWSCEIVGEVTDEAARETGLASGTPVIAGTTDAAAEAISAGMAHFGDAFMAGVGVGLFKDLTQITGWVKNKKSVTPDIATHQAYALNYKIFRNLYESTKSLMHELSDSLDN